MSSSWIVRAALGAIAACVATLPSGACGDGLVAPDAPTAPDDDRERIEIQFFGDPSLGSRPEVFFQAADGSLALATEVDQAGRANALMEAGGTVTVVVRAGAVRWMYTYLDVRPGEPIVLDVRRDPTPATYFLSVPRHPADAFVYLANVACDGFTDLAVIHVPESLQPVELHECEGPMELLVVAVHDAGTDYLYEQVPASSGNTLTPTGSYLPYRTSNIALRNAPPGFDSAHIDQRVSAVNNEAFMPLTDGSGDVQLQMPLAAGATLATRADLISATSISNPAVVTWGPVNATATLDFSPSLRAFVAAPTYDVAQRTLRWEESSTGEPGEVVVGRITYFRDTTNYIWTIIAPRTTEPAVQFPVLPRAGMNPTADDPVNLAALVTIAIEGGYDRIGHRLLGRWAPQRPWPLDTPSGAVQLQIYGQF